MKRIAIFVIRDRPEAGAAARELIGWLRAEGLTPLYHEELETHYGIPGGIGTDDIRKDAELVVVLGGDGSFLAAARMFHDRPVPILGVNFGLLGFLTETTIDELHAAVRRVIAGDYEIRERQMLKGAIETKNARTEFVALNEVVFSKVREARVIELDISVKGERMTSVRGDGIILATPTGTTAYNLSAGGPIVYPGLEATILTPICAHSLSFRPIVLPSFWEVRVELGRSTKQVLVTADGITIGPLDPGDHVTVVASKSRVEKVISPRLRYFEILRDKLGWGNKY
ncbi:NAD(+)/NADH kinase [bacterium]|nr:NAD(+)/NADH kinase [bacterium]